MGVIDCKKKKKHTKKKDADVVLMQITWAAVHEKYFYKPRLEYQANQCVFLVNFSYMWKKTVRLFSCFASDIAFWVFKCFPVSYVYPNTLTHCYLWF